MNPTIKLRWVYRDGFTPTREGVEIYRREHDCSLNTALNALKRPGEKILQQWWEHELDMNPGQHPKLGQWRDVPTETEE